MFFEIMFGVTIGLISLLIWGYIGLVALGDVPPAQFGDSFFGSVRWKFALAFCMILIFVTSLFIYSVNLSEQTHGSCKYEHWIGKTYACDEWYPLPIVTRQ